jgi:hypothetical protein
MKNDSPKPTPPDAQELRARLMNHLPDLQAFAGLPQNERCAILEEVREFVMKNYRTNSYLFPTGIELFMRLNMIHNSPDVFVGGQESEPFAPVEHPQSYIEDFIAERLGHHGESDGQGSFWLVAESALWITFGFPGRLNNRSLLLLTDAKQNTLALEMPFAIGEAVAFRGYDSIMEGRLQTEAESRRFEQIVRTYFHTDAPEDLAEFFKHPNFLFYAFSSLRELTDALDDITLSEDVIEDNG